MTKRRKLIFLKKHFKSLGVSAKDASFLAKYKLGDRDDANLCKRFNKVILKSFYDDIDGYYYPVPFGIVINNLSILIN